MAGPATREYTSYYDRLRHTPADLGRSTYRAGVSDEYVELVTTSQLARALGVSLRSVQRYIADGKIAAEHRTPGGHYRFDVDKVREQLRAIDHDE